MSQENEVFYNDVNHIVAPSTYEDHVANGIETYDIVGKRGVLIIISFKNAPNSRDIYKKDINALQKSFKQFNYDVVLISVDNKKELIKVLNETSQSNFKNCHSIFVTVLSNEGIEAAVSHNGEKITTKEFLNCFNETKCKSLQGKPKVFFFQAYTLRDNFSVEKTYPAERDYLLFYHIIEGNLSNRQNQMQNGSWFIKNLIKNIKSLGSKQDILSILTITFSDVYKDSQKFKTTYTYKKSPGLISTLTKKFYLYKEDYHNEENANDFNEHHDESTAENDDEESVTKTNSNDLVETSREIQNEENIEQPIICENLSHLQNFNENVTEESESDEKMDQTDNNNSSTNTNSEDLLESRIKNIEQQIVCEAQPRLRNYNENQIVPEVSSNEQTEVDGQFSADSCAEVVTVNEEIVNRCSLTNLLLPTILVVLVFGLACYLIFEEDDYFAFLNIKRGEEEDAFSKTFKIFQAQFNDYFN